MRARAAGLLGQKSAGVLSERAVAMVAAPKRPA